MKSYNAQKVIPGFGSHLTVRFQLHDLANRQRMFPDKKRGRPAKREESKCSTKSKDEAKYRRFAYLIKGWLNEHGWEYVENKDFIEAHNENKRWVINVQGIKRGRKQPLPVKVSEVLKHIEDTKTHYSIALMILFLIADNGMKYRKRLKTV